MFLKNLKRLMNRKKKTDESFPLTYHLTALRRLFICIALLAGFAFIGTFVFSDKILSWILFIAEKSGYRIVYLAPQEIILQQFRIAGLGSILFGLPFILFCLYCFVQVALNKREKRFIKVVGFAGYLCFWAGLYFMCRLAFPLMLQFFAGVNRGYDVTSAVSAQNFIDLCFMVSIIFGAITELPVICVLLAVAKILTLDKMKKIEKLVIVAVFVLGAIITPPDIISQLLVAVPMIMLYKLSELLVWIFQRKHNKLNKEI